MIAVTVIAVLTGCDAAPLGSTSRFTQNSGSMEPTIEVGQVITTRPVRGTYRPRHGDIVLFRGGTGRWGGNGKAFIKRVVAVGGETIACCDPAGNVTVDGEPIEEPYLGDNPPLDLPPDPRQCRARRFDPVAVPEGTVFVMGDNRAVSVDSRCAGPVPVTSVFATMID